MNAVPLVRGFPPFSELFCRCTILPSFPTPRHNVNWSLTSCTNGLLSPQNWRTDTPNSLAIHREAPPFVDQSTEMEMLVTGIKVRVNNTPDAAKKYCRFDQSDT